MVLRSHVSSHRRRHLESRVNACRRYRRPGFTFAEVLIAVALLAVLLSLAGQMLFQARRNSRIAEQRAYALRMVENSLEELTAQPWDQVHDDALAQLKLPESLLRRWPDAKISGDVEEQNEPVPAKRISVQLQLTPNQPALAAKLTTWIFRAPAEVEN